jgi:hypothetical protein
MVNRGWPGSLRTPLREYVRIHAAGHSMQNEARFVFRGWQDVRMQTQTLSKLALILATIWLGGKAAGAELQFRHHFIDRNLPVTDKLG